uniref:DUF6383 domain-containing protein n=1 Tax=Parabacteroides sp. AM08-6 TaxID=2292053 RepID=UPI001F1CEC88
KPYQFAFPFVSGESGAVYVQEQKDSKYLRIVNEYVTLTADKDEAIIINPVNTGEATANEGISTSEVSVIGGNGQVTINGAAGKKVVISNMLGQIKANTVITSDNETIAAPAGIVIVAVEGEEAVKAMVE